MQELENRVSNLETWRAEVDIAKALWEVEKNHIDQKVDKGFADLREGIKELRGYFSRIVWMIIGSIILGILGFVFAGGLVINNV